MRTIKPRSSLQSYPTVNDDRIGGDVMAFELLTVKGTNGQDFIHAAGDGREAPAGYHEIAIPDAAALILPRGGADIVYAGTGDDIVQIRQNSAISGLQEYLDGGGGNDTLLFSAAGGVCDISKATLVSIEGIEIAKASSFTLQLEASQMELIHSVEDRDPDHSFVRLQLADAGRGRIDFGTADNAVDEVDGSTGNDTLILKQFAADAIVQAGSGNDRVELSLRVGTDHASIYGGEGNDRLTGGNGKFGIFGDEGNDELTGGGHGDTLLGDLGNDVLDGGGGSDRLTGGLGTDGLSGGDGADMFIFRSAASSGPGDGLRDTIFDFAHDQGDRIDLSGIDADTATIGDQGFHLGGAMFTGVAGELIQYQDGTQMIVAGDVDGDAVADFELALTNAPTLVPADFLL